MNYDEQEQGLEVTMNCEIMMIFLLLFFTHISDFFRTLLSLEQGGGRYVKNIPYLSTSHPAPLTTNVFQIFFKVHFQEFSEIFFLQQPYISTSLAKWEGQ